MNPIARQESGGWIPALLSCLACLAAVTALFLADPVIRHFRYPVGWDAPYYVWRSAAVPFDGLTRLGAVRSGSPLLFALLAGATGRNAFTVVAVGPPVLAGILALAAAAMVRTALRIRAVWVPVIGFLAWVAFGRVGIMNGHFDQLLNGALVVAAFAAAVGFAGTGRGAAATGVLLAGAGLAEWPFLAFAVAVLLGALALFLVTGGDRRRAIQLLGAAGASAAFTALLFLVHPPGGRVGPSLSRPSLRALLKRRFLTRVRDPLRYVAFPLAVGGGLVAARAPDGESDPNARRLFASLMAAWVAVTIAAGLAQLAGIPVAGGRLTSYLFAVPILAGVFVWWVARTLRSRLPGPGGMMAVGLVVALAVGGFGAMAWVTGRERVPYFEPAGVRQAADAGRYADSSLIGRPVAFLVASPRGDTSTGGRWWHVVRAALPADVVARAERFDGSPAAFRADPEMARVAGIVLRRFNRTAYGEALREGNGTVVAPGVLALGMPAAPGLPPRPSGPPPQADLRVVTLLWLLPLLAGMLFVAGSGWARALLPPDPVIRIALAPALGTAVLSLAALGWELLGLGVAPWEAGLVIAAGSVAGWLAALGLPLTLSRRRASPPA